MKTVYPPTNTVCGGHKLDYCGELAHSKSCDGGKPVFSTSDQERQMSRIMRKPAFCICEDKGADQLCGYLTTQLILISAFVFSTLDSMVCVGPGR